MDRRQRALSRRARAGARPSPSIAHRTSHTAQPPHSRTWRLSTLSAHRSVRRRTQALRPQHIVRCAGLGPGARGTRGVQYERAGGGATGRPTYLKSPASATRDLRAIKAVGAEPGASTASPQDIISKKIQKNTIKRIYSCGSRGSAFFSSKLDSNRCHQKLVSAASAVRRAPSKRVANRRASRGARAGAKGAKRKTTDASC